MSLISRKYEKGRLVTRFCGVRVCRSADEPGLSLQAQLLLLKSAIRLLPAS